MNKPPTNHNKPGREHFIVRTYNNVRVLMRKDTSLRCNENEEGHNLVLSSSTRFVFQTYCKVLKKKRGGRLTSDKLIYYVAAVSELRQEEAFKHSSQTQEWEWDRGRWGGGDGHLLNHFRPHIPVTLIPVIRDHLKLICCLAACLDRISEDSHVLPDCLWSTADGSQDWASNEKRLVSWSVRPLFELGVGRGGGGGRAVERCLAYDFQMCQLLKRLFSMNLRPKDKPTLPFSYCDSLKKKWQSVCSRAKMLLKLKSALHLVQQWE